MRARELAKLPRMKGQEMQAAEELQRIVKDITRKAARCVEGLYKEPTEPGYNRDADLPWNEASVKTRVSLELLKQSSKDTGDGEAKRVFGVIFMQGRSKDAKEWEAEARRIDTEEKRKGAIDAEVADE